MISNDGDSRTMKVSLFSSLRLIRKRRVVRSLRRKKRDSEIRREWC